MLEIFTVGIKKDGALSIEINEDLLKVANEEDLINAIDGVDTEIIYRIVHKISDCIIEGE